MTICQGRSLTSATPVTVHRAPVFEVKVEKSMFLALPRASGCLETYRPVTIVGEFVVRFSVTRCLVIWEWEQSGQL